MVDWLLRRAEVDGGDAPVAPRPWRGWLWPRLELGRLGDGSGGTIGLRGGRIFRRRSSGKRGHWRRSGPRAELGLGQGKEEEVGEFRGEKWRRGSSLFK